MTGMCQLCARSSIAAACLLFCTDLAFARAPECYEVDDPPPSCGWSDTYAPSKPTGFAATAVSGSQINLSWTASYDSWGVTGYLLERCEGASCSNFAQVATATTTSYSDTGRVSGVTYRYRVRATDAAGNLSSYSTEAAATTPDVQAPSAPASLSASAASGTQINLTWSASSDNIGVSGYLVEGCQGAGCANFAQIAVAGSTSYGITGLTAATTYSFRVRAYDAVPNYGGYSPVATATTPDTVAPSTPGALSAIGASSTQINLSWSASSDNVGVTGYAIERCQGDGCSNFAHIATTTTTGYSNSGLTPATAYSYRVRAHDAVPNYSGYAEPVTLTLADAQPPAAPTTPATLTLTVGTNNIVISWRPPADSTGVQAYEVQRCAGAGCSFSTIATVLAPATVVTDSNITFGVTYSYRVRARNAASIYGDYATSGTVTGGYCD